VTSVPAPSAAASDNEFRRGWPILVASVIGVGCSVTAVPFYSGGPFVKELEAAFDEPRATIQIGYTIGSILVGLAAPLVGGWVDRWGGRRVALFGLTGCGISLILLGLISQNLITFYIAFALLAMLGAASSPVAWTRIIASWFEKKRGLALGLCLMGTGICAAIMPAYATWAVERFGWRGGYFALAMWPLLIGLPVAFLLLRERKIDTAAPTLSAGDAEIQAEEKAGLTPAEAFRNYRFWVLGLGFFAISLAVGVNVGNFIPMLTDYGMAPQLAAQLAGLIGISIIVGRVSIGYLIDRMWAPGVAAIASALPIATCVILADSSPTVTGTAIAAICVGFAAGAEFDLIAFLAAKYFGLKHYGKIYGYLFLTLMLGAGISAPIGGSVYDMTGSYAPALYAGAIVCLAGALSLLSLGRYPNFGGGSAH
jgi:MFS family permease